MTDDETDRRMNDIEARVEALSRRQKKLKRLLLGERLMAELDGESSLWALLDDLDQRLSDLEAATGINLDNADYAQLSKPAKVKRVREALVEEARSNAGKASMKYKDVVWLFGGEPSPGHAYDLMEQAGEKEGFDYQTDPPGGKDQRLVVDLEDVNDQRLVHGANNAEGSEDR